MSRLELEYLYTAQLGDLGTLTAVELATMRAAVLRLGLGDVAAEHDALIEVVDRLWTLIDEGDQILGRLRPIWKAVGADPEVQSQDEASAELTRAICAYRCTEEWKP